MYTNILVPLDGSKWAEMILPYVFELAIHFETSVILLRVIELLKHDSRPKVSFSSVEIENTEQRIDLPSC